MSYKRRNDAFYQDYLEGTLDLQAYLAFSMQILAATEPARLAQWHQAFMRDCIEPIILPKAVKLIEQHRGAGDQLVIITATNRFVTDPIARRLGVRTLLATECEQRNGRYTGRSTDIPCFREGKVTRLQRWMLENGHDLTDSCFYSDSLNDLPLLERVTHPVAVDPDPTLRAEAERRGWKIISLRD